jgi:hypothetical protein
MFLPLCLHFTSQDGLSYTALTNDSITKIISDLRHLSNVGQQGTQLIMTSQGPQYALPQSHIRGRNTP